jgi:hypothetical protein
MHSFGTSVSSNRGVSGKYSFSRQNIPRIYLRLYGNRLEIIYCRCRDAVKLFRYLLSQQSLMDIFNDAQNRIFRWLGGIKGEGGR